MEPFTQSLTRIKQLFSYDPETGIVRRTLGYGRAYEGQIMNARSIQVDGVWYPITHIIWVLHHGDFPPVGHWIDHIDGVKAHNRMVNLRLATPTQNQQNKAGYGQYAKGVTWRNRQTKPYQAKIRVNGTRIHLGSFATEEEAAKAYQDAAVLYHGEFACLV
jgi:hypothetical protein